MVKPAIRVVNSDAPAHGQQGLHMATKEACYYRVRSMFFPKPPQELLSEVTALTHAERLLQSEGVPAP